MLSTKRQDEFCSVIIIIISLIQLVTANKFIARFQNNPLNFSDALKLCNSQLAIITQDTEPDALNALRDNSVRSTPSTHPNTAKGCWINAIRHVINGHLADWEPNNIIQAMNTKWMMRQLTNINIQNQHQSNCGTFWPMPKSTNWNAGPCSKNTGCNDVNDLDQCTYCALCMQTPMTALSTSATTTTNQTSSSVVSPDTMTTSIPVDEITTGNETIIDATTNEPTDRYQSKETARKAMDYRVVALVIACQLTIVLVIVLTLIYAYSIRKINTVRS